MTKMIIVSNQVHCKLCDDRPFSAHVHDFKQCKCGNIAVDGGTEYFRRVGNINRAQYEETYEDISISLPEEVINKAIAEVKEAQRTGRNERGLVYAAIRGMRDGGYDFENGTVGK